MENLKIRVNNEQESKEAQELFSGLGYVKDNWLWSGLNEYPIELKTRDEGYSDFKLNSEDAIERQEITLPELRAMVNQDQDEPFLTPETTLNDQYAEIEQARQTIKASWPSLDMQRIENVAKAAKAVADSWPSIVAGAKANTGIHGTAKAKPDFNFGAAQAAGGVEATLTERQTKYGCYEDVAQVTQQILAALRIGNYDKLPAPMKESLHMIASKMARIVNGDPEYFDNWHDIGGYAKLIEKLIKGE